MSRLVISVMLAVPDAPQAVAWYKRAPGWRDPAGTGVVWGALRLVPGLLGFFGHLPSPPAWSTGAAVFVAVPPASWLLMTLPLMIAALFSRRTPRDRQEVG